MHIISMSNHPCAMASCPLKYIYLAFCKKKALYYVLLNTWFHEFPMPYEFGFWDWSFVKSCGEQLIIQNLLLCAQTCGIFN